MYFWKNESSLKPLGAFFPLRPGRFNGMDFTMYAVDMRDTILKRESAFEQLDVEGDKMDGMYVAANTKGTIMKATCVDLAQRHPRLRT